MFIRTYRCNLSCTWCDTKYTWIGQDKAKAGVDYSLMTIGAVMDKVASFGCKHLVLTGGEPLLHQKVLAPLLAGLKAADFYIEVETNGTIAPSVEAMRCVDSFNVSPKLSNSLIGEGSRTRPESLDSFARSKKAWLKFVVCEEEDIGEIERLISRFGLPRDRVMLMPEGIDESTILARSQWLVEICKEKGFRFAPRLHILLYGNKRGT